MAVGAGVKLLLSLAFLLPSEMSTALPVLPKAELALELAPALFGVGYILGYRQGAICVAGVDRLVPGPDAPHRLDRRRA